MHSTSLDARLEAGITILREAGALALDHFRNRANLAIEAKGLQDFVSIADRQVERVIRQRLTEQFPDDGLLGEEEGGALSERMWIIDPIDGTANFLRGLPYWCVTMAFAINGRTEIGITFDAVHDEMFWARRGRGASRDGQKMQVSGRSDPSEACIAFAYSFKIPAERFLGLQAGLLHHKVDMRRLGSSALVLAHVADGRIDGVITPRAWSWDVLGGLLMVEEAGGDATDYGDGFTLSEPRGVFGATPGLATIVRDLTQATAV